MELVERVEALERQLDDLTARGACTRYPLVDMYDESFDASREYLEMKANAAVISERGSKELTDRVLTLEKRVWFLRWQIQVRS